jgi:transposase
MTHIAMDVHKNRSKLAYVTPSMAEPELVGCYTTPEGFAQVLSGLPGPWVVCIEATRQSPAVVRWLRELGVEELHLVDPHALHRHLKGKPKTDARDAKEMLELHLIGRLPECYLATQRVQDQRALSRGREGLRRISTQLRNLLRALLTQQGRDLPVRDLRGKAGQEQMAAVIPQLPPLTQCIVQLLWALLEHVELALKAAETRIREEVDADPIAQALTTLSGIGPVLAFGLVAEIAEIERFEDPAHLISYAGLAPRANDSDGYHGPRHLPACCSKRLRHWAILGTQSAARCRGDSNARRTYQRIAQRLKPNTAKIAAARALLKDVFYAWQQAIASLDTAA